MPINFKKEINGNVTETVQKLSEALKTQGFGILTRIDMHEKIREKLGKEIPAVVILGACNPAMAFEAYSMNPDVTSLLPCNAVVREIASGRVSIEITKPTALMEILHRPQLVELARKADTALAAALESMH